jgi:hypothetical protein
LIEVLQVVVFNIDRIFQSFSLIREGTEFRPLKTLVIFIIIKKRLDFLNGLVASGSTPSWRGLRPGRENLPLRERGIGFS